MSVVLETTRTLEPYLSMPDEEIAERIEYARRELGPRVIILGHHYQRDDVIRHADLTGDSYQLSVMASQTEAEAMPTAPVSRQAVSRQPPAKTAARSQPHTGHTTRKQH